MRRKKERRYISVSETTPIQIRIGRGAKIKLREMSYLVDASMTWLVTELIMQYGDRLLEEIRTSDEKPKHRINAVTKARLGDGV